MRRLFLPFALLAVACGGSGGGPSGPPVPERTIASIAVTPASARVDVGRTVQFRATARSAAGSALSGVTFTWEVSNPAVASIDASGLATGRAAGEVTVRATARGRTGTARLEVREISPVAIEAIAPVELVPGEAATITGRGFADTPENNAVTVGGADAEVTSASATELEIVVPRECLPAGPAEVRVTVEGNVSGLATHPIRPLVEPFELEPGRQTIVTGPEVCLQFAASEEFLVGVQSTRVTSDGLSGLRVHARLPETAASALVPSASRPTRSGPSVPTARDPIPELLELQREGELRLRREERRLEASADLSTAALRARAGGRTLAPAAVPEEGETMEVRVPDFRTNGCTVFETITAVARRVGENVIFVEDVENPPGGFTADQYGALSEFFDEDNLPTLVDYFGEIPDIDDNGRVVVVVTRKLNEWLETFGAIGFVTAVDLVDRGTCPSSNTGEFYYSIAPDPSGEAGRPFQAVDMFFTQRILLAHEVAHVIQFGRRFMVPDATAFLPAWQAEGQATLAEEVVGFAVRDRAPGNNYGEAVILEDVALNWHLGAFGDLVSYFGFRNPNTRVAGAPERCTFLSNLGPCVGGMIYGVSWSFLRWLSDTFGPAMPGGEQAIHRALIEHPGEGVTNLEEVVGAPMEDLLPKWAASLYLDDRVEGLDPDLEWTSWNLFSLDQEVVESARLKPYRPLPAGVGERVLVAPGSSAYWLLGGESASSLLVRADELNSLPSGIQVWVVRTR